MHYAVISTGSIGNSYAFYDGSGTIIIDAGVSCKKIIEGLGKYKIPDSSVIAILITHLHPDHAKGAAALSKKLGVDIYISDIAFNRNKKAMNENKIEQAGVFEIGKSFELGNFKITSFRTVHDSEGSVGFRFENSSSTVFLMTDTGIIPDGARELALNSTLKFIESNYDEEMLYYSSYSDKLKNRIAGRYGHLSNEDAVSFALFTSKPGDIVRFVHLSENSNTVESVEKLASGELPDFVDYKALGRGESMDGYLDE